MKLSFHSISKTVFMILLGCVSVIGVGEPPTAHAQGIQFETFQPCLFDQYASRDDLTVGAVVLDFRNGAGCIQNLNTTFPMASVGKLFILGAFYEEVAAGRLSFDREFTFTERYYMGGRNDCLGTDQLGETFTLGYIGDTMIWCSDNAATWIIYDIVGPETVQNYIDRLGIAGIGEVIPYALVDQLKLAQIDSRWADVPTHIASQYYRNRGETDVSGYFTDNPRYSRDEYRAANAAYLNNFAYNTATPHAMAQYIVKLRTDLQLGTQNQRTVARWIFNTMLLTQRQFASQHMPATVYVGSKNGFDFGYRAEVNVTIRDFETYLPETLSIVVVRHNDLEEEELVPFRFTDVPTTDYLLDVSPVIAQMLYPTESVSNAPALGQDFRLRRVYTADEIDMANCFRNFVDYDYLDGLTRCWGRLEARTTFRSDEYAGLGFIFRDLNLDDLRLGLVFTLPDGSVRTYQVQRFFRDDTAIVWYERVDMRGVWRVDAYFNLVPVYSGQITVN